MSSPSFPRISLIAAVARNGVIGRDNALIWHIPADLAHFKKITHGHPILMGRRTWESIGRPLPGRRNIVITRREDWRADGAEPAASLEQALALCAEAPEVFVIGGAQVYAEAMPLAHRLWLTEIDATPEGHVHFPDWPREAFEPISREHHAAQGSLPAYDFVLYERRPAR
ncbi:MAG: dihydrofolate reductase, partial [Betaproteobacteria bacterium]|nr:dihydrofolate reductase [Betaproteobacteria bacterium]